MLSCAEFLAEFGDYLEEAASPEVRARLEEHRARVQDLPGHCGQHSENHPIRYRL